MFTIKSFDSKWNFFDSTRGSEEGKYLPRVATLLHLSWWRDDAHPNEMNKSQVYGVLHVIYAAHAHTSHRVCTHIIKRLMPPIVYKI